MVLLQIFTSQIFSLVCSAKTHFLLFFLITFFSWLWKYTAQIKKSLLTLSRLENCEFSQDILHSPLYLTCSIYSQRGLTRGKTLSCCKNSGVRGKSNSSNNSFCVSTATSRRVMRGELDLQGYFREPVFACLYWLLVFGFCLAGEMGTFRFHLCLFKTQPNALSITRPLWGKSAFSFFQLRKDKVEFSPMRMLLQKKSLELFFVCSWLDHHWSMLIPCRKVGGQMDLLMLCPIFEELSPVMAFFTLHFWDSLEMLQEYKNHLYTLWLFTCLL